MSAPDPALVMGPSHVMAGQIVATLNAFRRAMSPANRVRECLGQDPLYIVCPAKGFAGADIPLRCIDRRDTGKEHVALAQMQHSAEGDNG